MRLAVCGGVLLPPLRMIESFGVVMFFLGAVFSPPWTVAVKSRP